MAQYTIEQAHQQASSLLKDAIAGSGIQAAIEPTLDRPKDLAMGDLAFSGAFELAKSAKRSPIQIAEGVAAKANELLKGGKYPLLASVTAVKGYVNISFSASFFHNTANEAIGSSAQFGASQIGAGKTAVVEYSQPNVGKPMHVGHIRSTILGDAVKRLLRFVGYRSIGFNYLGDSGAQVAKLILATKVLGQQLPKITDEKDLLAYYVAIHKRIEAQPELELEAQTILKKIELGDPGVMPEVERIRGLSLPAFERNYGLLDVTFDEVKGESAFIQEAKEIVRDCVENGIAQKADTGEVVAKLEPYGLPNTIILRSNGTTLYLTRDLGLAEYKWRKYAPDLFYICTDSRQDLHFRQVFKIIELLKREYAPRLVHQGFGFISLPEGLMSTREGRVVLLEDVLNGAIQAAKSEITAERKGEYTDEQVEQISRAVGIAATKFAVLRVAPEKNVVFDFKQMVRFSGDTGAYLQYTTVRTRSLIAKAGGFPAQNTPAANPLSVEERKLLRLISEFPLLVQTAARKFTPHILCEYMLETAAAFSEFYEKQPVLKAENESLKAQRLRIVRATQVVLENGMQLLGIRAPEKM